MENYKQKYEEVVKEISKLRDMLLEEEVIHIGGIIDDNFKRIFPELKESEDERIRKEMIFYFTEEIPQCSIQEHSDKMREFISWLKRQEVERAKLKLKAGNSYFCYKSRWERADSETFKKGLIYKCNKDGVLDNFVVRNPEQHFIEIKDEHIAWLEKQGEQKISDIDNKFIRMRETKPKDISEFLDRLTTVEQEFLWEHIAKIRELDKEEQKLQGKSALEAAKEEKVDNQNCVKPEQKFKVGDFIVNDYCIGRVVETTNDAYLLDTEQGIPFSCHSTRLWDVTKDAKDGDVLACENGWTCIFKKLVNDETFSSYCFMDNTKWFCETGSECHTLKEEFVKVYNGKIYPATKEQCDLLFQKMKETGYEWDAEKKELKKIIIPIYNIGDRVRYKGYECDSVITKITDTDYICNNAVLPIPTQDKLELVEQNLAWSKEDETYLNTIISDLDYSKAIHNKAKCNFIDKEIKWFKSLKNRVQPQSKQEWSKDDEEIANKGVLILKSCAVGFPTDEKFANEFEIWIKSLKNRVHPNRKWSEEDKEMYRKVETAINSYYAPFSRDAEEMSEWFKNLKYRVQLKQEWSEEDKEVISLLSKLIYEQDKLSPRIPSNEKRKRMLSWLKSLKDRVQPM